MTLPAERRGHVETCPECGSYVDVPYATALASPAQATAARNALEAANRPAGVARCPRTTVGLWLEVLAVLCLAYVPYLFSALTAANGSWPTSHESLDLLLYRLIGTLRISAPVLVIMALSRDPWRLFGVVRPAWLFDTMATIVIAGGGAAVSRFVLHVLPEWMLESSRPAHLAQRVGPGGIAAVLLVSVVYVAGAFSEELVMRGYLIPRLERLLHSMLAALVVTSLLFGSCHLYQGVGHAIDNVVFGLFYGISFCAIRRIWPLCAAHALQNLLIVL
jgi:membrane protease YdiL (CAAX protease family)